MLSAAVMSAAARPLRAGDATTLLLYRNLLAYRKEWWVFVAGFFEPVFYLLSIGIGVGSIVHGFEFNGQQIDYRAFVAPGMIAASAMNGAIMDATYSFFFKLKYNKLFDQMLATPVTTLDVVRGELSWSLLRGGIYSAVFLLITLAMGLVGSWWAVLVVPAALLIGLVFGALGMALTTGIRSRLDFGYITLSTMPMFLFSATFFPVTAFPGWLRWIVEFTPLYRGVVLCRELTTGTVGWGSAVSSLYLLALGVFGLALVRRRLDNLLLT
jgi:lipooligosaccharide transport system permease protein